MRYVKGREGGVWGEEMRVVFCEKSVELLLVGEEMYLVNEARLLDVEVPDLKGVVRGEEKV